MLRFSDITIKSKLYGLVLFSAFGLAAVLGLALWVLHEYRVNGPVYDRIMRRTTALAEVEPSSFYTVESYLILVELSVTTDEKEIRQLIDEFNAHEKLFNDREVYWTEHLFDGPLKTALSQDVFPSGHEFFRLVKEEYLAAVRQSGRSTAGGFSTQGRKIRPSFLKQRDAIERTVKIAREGTAREEEVTNSALTASGSRP